MATPWTCRDDPRVLPDRRIELTWSDGAVSCYHFVWLRQQLFNPAIGRSDQGAEDALLLPDEPETLHVGACRVDGRNLIVTWGHDGAETSHDLGWLRDNAYDRDLRLARKARPVPWLGKDASQYAWHGWDDVMSDDGALWDVFTGLRDRGLVRLNGAPTQDGAVGRLAERFGPIRVTDFGAISDIRSRPRGEAGRYAAIGAGGFHRLAPHTDEGWRYAPPGISFHLSMESTPAAGGASMLCDGFMAAERLRRNDTEAFAFLTSVPLRFSAARNPQERYFAHGRLIATDRDGDIVGVRFSDRTLGAQDLPEEMIEPAYRALRAFAKELYADDLLYTHALMPGDVHIFDNHRVLHARAAFDPEAGPRRIQQCAVDREEFHNRLRQLAETLGHDDDAKMILPEGALG